MDNIEGYEHMARGEKALAKRWSIWNLFADQENKYAIATDAFVKAGNVYKVTNEWQMAGSAFIRAAETSLSSEYPGDAVNHYIEAGNAFKNVSAVHAVGSFVKAIEIYSKDGKFGLAARLFGEIAAIYETEDDTDDAMEAYECAAEFFEKDHKPVSVNQMLLKVAEYASQKGDIPRAAKMFEKIAKESLQNHLGSDSAQNNFFQSLLCHLASGNNVRIAKKVVRFKSLDSSFGVTKECELIEKLLQAIENRNLDDFTSLVFDFDRITPLNPWQTSMLLKAKKYVSDNAVDVIKS